MSSSPKSPKSPVLGILDSDDDNKIDTPDFTAKWRLIEYKGIDEYLKSEGWSWMMRKAISKLGNNQYIYHHHQSNCDGKEEENITIKSVYKGGIYEIISNANLNDKKEIKYKDKNGDKIISVFKWNKSKKEIIEFLLKEITIKNNNNAPKYKRKSKVKQKSYTKCRYIDNKGQMIETITNQIGKKCISIYIKDDDDQPTIKQLKNILHLPNENNENNDDQKDYKLPQFPINIIEIEKIVTERKDDDEKLNIENVKIQKEIQKLSEQITILKEKLIIKTEELKHNITKNDELISQKNTIKKWGEFQSEWNNWDCLYFMGWLQRIKWENKNYNSYNITKNGINRYCMKTFNTKHFIGKYLIKFDRDAMRQIGIEDEKDSFCIYKQILDLIKKYPLKQYQSPLKYYGEEKKKK
eukprot:125955_1